MSDDAKVFCVTCGEWFPDGKTGLTDGMLSECQHCTDARDADRYRWLRSRDLDTITRGGVFAGKMPEKQVVNGIDLDRYIDKAIRQSEEAEKSIDEFELSKSQGTP